MLSADVLAKVDQLAGSRHSRSAIIDVVFKIICDSEKERMQTPKI